MSSEVQTESFRHPLSGVIVNAQIDHAKLQQDAHAVEPLWPVYSGDPHTVRTVKNGDVCVEYSANGRHGCLNVTNNVAGSGSVERSQTPEDLDLAVAAYKDKCRVLGLANGDYNPMADAEDQGIPVQVAGSHSMYKPHGVIFPPGCDVMVRPPKPVDNASLLMPRQAPNGHPSACFLWEIYPREKHTNPLELLSIHKHALRRDANRWKKVMQDSRSSTHRARDAWEAAVQADDKHDLNMVLNGMNVAVRLGLCTLPKGANPVKRDAYTGFDIMQDPELQRLAEVYHTNLTNKGEADASDYFARLGQLWGLHNAGPAIKPDVRRAFNNYHLHMWDALNYNGMNRDGRRLFNYKGADQDFVTKTGKPKNGTPNGEMAKLQLNSRREAASAHQMAIDHENRFRLGRSISSASRKKIIDVVIEPGHP